MIVDKNNMITKLNQVVKFMNNEEQLDLIFQSLANKHRRAIVYRLSLQPSSISKLAHENNLSLPAINKHIKVLEKANFIQRKKVSTTHFLALKRESLRTLHDWIKQYNPYWGSDIETLENYIDKLNSDN